MKQRNKAILILALTLCLFIGVIWLIFESTQPRQTQVPMTQTQQNVFINKHEELKFFLIWADYANKGKPLSYATIKQGLLGTAISKSVLMQLDGTNTNIGTSFYPITLEFDLADSDTSVLASSNKQEIVKQDTLYVSIPSQSNLDIDYWVTRYSLSSTDQELTVYFSLHFLGQTINGQSESTLISGKIDQTILDEYQTKMEEQLISLGSMIGLSHSLSILLDRQSAQFYNAYRLYSGGEYLFKPERSSERVDQLWVIKQTFTSPQSTVTFVYDQTGAGKEIRIDRNESSTSVHELFQTIEVISLNSLDHWSFPETYFNQIRSKFSPNDLPWRLETSEGSGIECLEAYTHYRFWW
ncbi:MAG: hypothetical protein FD133_1651 [Erysipelotrichaceae bacterium]|nr:MAG: hypothetical protein FD179_1802 [Erysipelotrichaceae bacterium]TXT16833.1 MAG: hypothetical protein FD133_1651 [Erysipelotrichaceae bacterium]